MKTQSSSRDRACLSVIVLALVASCSSVPHGVVSVETRGTLDSPVVLEVLGALLGVTSSSGTYGSSGAAGNAGKYPYNSYDEDEAVRSFGFRAAISTPIVDVVGGYDAHFFGSQNVPEASIGLRKRFTDSEADSVYVQILGRRGYNIRTDTGREDYDGIAIGIGGISFIDEHWFIDVSIEFESTLERLDIGGDHEYLSDVLLSVGIGFSL